MLSNTFFLSAIDHAVTMVLAVEPVATQTAEALRQAIFDQTSYCSELAAIEILHRDQRSICTRMYVVLHVLQGKHTRQNIL